MEKWRRVQSYAQGVQSLGKTEPLPNALTSLWRNTNACLLSCFSYVWLFATLWTVARQTSLSMEFSRQEYWRGLPGIEPTFLVSSALTGGFFTTSATRQTPKHTNTHVNWWKWKLWIVSSQLRSGFKAKIWAKFIQNPSL